jgi:hypothetical protein
MTATDTYARIIADLGLTRDNNPAYLPIYATLQALSDFDTDPPATFAAVLEKLKASYYGYGAQAIDLLAPLQDAATRESQSGR